MSNIYIALPDSVAHEPSSYLISTDTCKKTTHQHPLFVIINVLCVLFRSLIFPLPIYRLMLCVVVFLCHFLLCNVSTSCLSCCQKDGDSGFFSQKGSPDSRISSSRNVSTFLVLAVFLVLFIVVLRLPPLLVVPFCEHQSSVALMVLLFSCLFFP